MNDRGFLVALAGFLALGVGLAQSNSSTGPATLIVREQEGLGAHLTDGQGYTLYIFLDDRSGESSCTGECARTWPPLLTRAAPVAGEGVDASLLGTYTREGGGVQVVYNGYPLYTFSGDTAPGDINGQDANDIWYGISPQGLRVSNEVEGEEKPGGP